jgi:MYXO-CTERM domain-containing protein
VDCCLPKDDKEKGAGFLIADRPDAATIQILHPEIPYNQLDGFFQTVGGSEPAYNLSTYLGTEYINDREVTFITGALGPGDQDVWMTGYVDGECDIGDDDVGLPPGECNSGKVSYLGGHSYKVETPVTENWDSQGTRLFLNALFEADCVTSVGQPDISLSLAGDLVVGAASVPVESTFTAHYANQGRGAALDAVLAQVYPAGVELVDMEDLVSPIPDGIEWIIGSISGNPPLAGDPPSAGSRWTTLRFPDYGDYEIEVRLSYRVGISTLEAPVHRVTVRVAADSDGDGVADEIDPYPDDPNRCGDSDEDTCDDCAVTGTQDPANDGPDEDGDGICDAGDTDGPSADNGDGCSCRAGSPGDAALWLLVLAFLLAPRRRRRR